MMEGEEIIPLEDRQQNLFRQFVEVLSNNLQHTSPVSLTFDELRLRQRDVKLMIRDDNASAQLIAAQLKLEEALREKEPGFDFAKGHPLIENRFFTTILRFKEGFSGDHYSRLVKILEETASDFSNSPLEMTINPGSLFAVQFNGLFDPWVKEVQLISEGY